MVRVKQIVGDFMESFKRILLVVDGETHRAFKLACEERGIPMCRALDAFMKDYPFSPVLNKKEEVNGEVIEDIPGNNEVIQEGNIKSPDSH